MKYVQILIAVSFVAINLIGHFSCVENKNSLEKKFHEPQHSDRKTTLNWDLRVPEDANIFYQGWIRYYHYSTALASHVDKPKVFFQNNRYYNQRIKKPHHKATDKFGPYAIPNKAGFFAIIYNNTLAVFDGRDDILARQVDGLPIEYIGDIYEDDILKGSIRDFGEFPTGSCTEIKADIPRGYKGPKIPNYWIVCFDSNKEKGKFMKTLIKLRVRLQRNRNPIPVTKHSSILSHGNPMAESFHKPGKLPSGSQKEEKKSILDGYWILLQDWTDCTLKCGGGKSYQHWMCVPPKNGGKPCQGKAIRTHPCNTQACPSAQKYVQKNTMSREVEKNIRKPIMRVGRFSQRPQRYSKCEIKENDAYLTEFDEHKKVTKKLPVRLIMNNSTISVFQDDFYTDLLFSYQLDDVLYAQGQAFCCFGLQDGSQQHQFCGYPENCGNNIKKDIWADGWKKDWYLFKIVCKEGREGVLLTEDDLKGIDDANLNPPETIDIDMVMKRKRQLRTELHEKQKSIFRKNIAQTQEIGWKALQREISIEKMVKNEEKHREDIEIQTLEKQVKQEKKKADCIHKTIQEKDWDDSYDEKEEALEEMERLKTKLKQKVSDSRLKVKKLLSNMKSKADRKKKSLQQQLKAIRTTMAKEILLANKEGDIRNCKIGKKDLDFREKYCNKNFIEYYVNNAACKSNDDFCYTCCEHEFGAEYRVKRNVCYKMCDEKPKEIQRKKEEARKKENPEPQQWLWAPTVEVKSGGDAAMAKGSK